MAYTIEEFAKIDVEELHRNERVKCSECGREVDENGDPVEDSSPNRNLN
jgi:hypothetical protein